MSFSFSPIKKKRNFMLKNALKKKIREKEKEREAFPPTLMNDNIVECKDEREWEIKERQ